VSNSRYRDRLGAVQRKGVQPTDITPGAVFTVNDKAIYFPTDDAKRTFHPERWAIIVQSQYSTEERPKTVLVIPCSSSGDPDLGDWPISQDGLNGKLFTADRVTAYVNLLQPCPKALLHEYKGHLDGTQWGRILRRIADLFGLQAPAPQTEIPPRT
jgi:hypothetical protein